MPAQIHRKEGTARDLGAGLAPHKLLPSSFLCGLEPQRAGCRLSCSPSIQGDNDTVLPSHHWLPTYTCWLVSGAGGLRPEPKGRCSVCTAPTGVLERPGWLQPQLVTWGCYPEQSVSQTRVGGYATTTSLSRAPRAIEQLSNRFLLSYVCAFSQRFAQLLRVGWR